MIRMTTADVMVHKGEKEEKYQLYVEDYVMSYLKNNKDEKRELFFYGKREADGKKYYIYGAADQKGITYFKQFVLLEEIQCRFAEDMPMFSVREREKSYELAGYYIFYQSNEAMQNYMVEHRKKTQYKARTETENRIRERSIEKTAAQHSGVKENSGRKKSGLMAVQMAAVFVVLIAIVINSTNSYTKLEELNQAAVEVFFAMENQDAADERGRIEDDAGTEEGITAEGTVLRLEDLDAKFEEENQAVQAEETEAEKGGTGQSTGEAEQNAGETKQGADETKQGADGAETSVEKAEPGAAEVASAKEESVTEAVPSKQAYGRNFAEYYQIEKGDTLYTISIKLYGDTSKVNEICELNQIKDPDNIKYGQKILLP